MAQVTAPFTAADGTLLTAYNASDGSPFTKGGGASTGEITNNRFRSTLKDAVAFWYPATAPATADQQIQHQYKVGNTASTGPALFLRTDATIANGYAARYAAGGWSIFKWVSGTRTTIASYTGGNVNAANGETVIFKIVGTTITLTVAGTQIISVTDTSLATKNRWGPGLFFTDVSTTDIWVDDMDAKDVAASNTLATSLTGSATFAAALTLNQYLSAALSGTASLAGAVSLQQSIVAAVQGSGSLTAQLSASIALSASMTASAGLAAALSLQSSMAASLTGTAAVSAALTTQIALAASLAGSAALASQATLRSYLSAALTGSATLSALLADDGLRASLAGTAALSAQLTNRLSIASALAGSADLSANVSLRMALASALTASADIASALTSRIALAANVSGSATLISALTLEQRLSAMLQGNATLSASLILAGATLPLSVSLSGSALLRSHLSNQSAINGKLQGCVIEWLAGVTGVQSIILNQNAPRPALPYSAVHVEKVAPQWDASRSAPDAFDTVELVVPQDVFMALSFYGPGALDFAEAALDSLGKPSIQAVFEECGCAVVSTTAITNAARLVADRYEGGATFKVIFRISDALHDNSGSLGSVSLEGSYGSNTVAQTIN